MMCFGTSKEKERRIKKKSHTFHLYIENWRGGKRKKKRTKSQSEIENDKFFGAFCFHFHFHLGFFFFLPSSFSLVCMCSFFFFFLHPFFLVSQMYHVVVLIFTCTCCNVIDTTNHNSFCMVMLWGMESQVLEIVVLIH